MPVAEFIIVTVSRHLLQQTCEGLVHDTFNQMWSDSLTHRIDSDMTEMRRLLYVEGC